MNIDFLSTVAVIASDPPASRKLYVDALGLQLESHGDDYHHSEHIAGCRSFGIWPLSQAAEARSCRGWGTAKSLAYAGKKRLVSASGGCRLTLARQHTKTTNRRSRR